MFSILLTNDKLPVRSTADIGLKHNNMGRFWLNSQQPLLGLLDAKSKLLQPRVNAFSMVAPIPVAAPAKYIQPRRLG